MFFKGFKFGLLLQIAIGPVCLFILNVAINSTLINSLFAVLAVTLVDAVYIILAVFSVISFIKNNKYSKLFKILSGIVVLLFGLNIILSSFNINLIPSLNLILLNNINNSFIYALILTASNPLTILFWSGIFSARVIEEKYKNMDLYFFAAGCVGSTFIFLTFVSILGILIRFYLSKEIIKALNIIVGIILIYFSIRVFTKKTEIA